LEALAESLRYRSSGFRKAVLSVLQKQKPASLASVIGKMLFAGEEYQIQAAAELLLGFREEHPELLRGQAEALSCLKERKLSTQTRILLDRLDGEEEARVEYTEENGFVLYDPKELERQ